MTFRRRPIAGGPEILTHRLFRELARHLDDRDVVRLCVRGARGHGVAFLWDRLIILKAGYHAGTTFGSMATTIFYGDITALHIRTQLVTGWIEIATPSFQPRERKRVLRRRSAECDEYKLPNCIPINRRHRAEYSQALQQLHSTIAAAKGATRSENDVTVVQLERLATLRRAGHLSESEFRTAKGRILAVSTREAGNWSPG